MDAEKYVNAIARKIKCSGKKKKEIRMQLLTDIQMRIKQGERLEDIISQMGTAKEISDGFNETISMEERKKYHRNRVLKIVIPVILAFILLILYVYWMVPKSVPIEQSIYFNKEQVEEAMKETIALLDEEDYTALQENAIPQMQAFLNAEEMGDVRKMVSDGWGERKQFGTVYLVEIIQGNSHLAVGEITVTYENVSVTYRMTYDKDLRLAGIYIR